MLIIKQYKPILGHNNVNNPKLAMHIIGMMQIETVPSTVTDKLIAVRYSTNQLLLVRMGIYRSSI